MPQIKHAYGFDRPLPVQYLLWLGHVLTGDFGISIATRRPVILEVDRRPVEHVHADLLRRAARVHPGLHHGRDSRLLPRPRWSTASSPAPPWSVSVVPNYWLGIVLVIIFAVELCALPATGMGPTRLGAVDIAALVTTLQISRAAGHHAVDDPGRHHRAHHARRGGRGAEPGFRRRRCAPRDWARWAVIRHVAEERAPQVLAVMGLQFGYLLGGSILVETVFTWPGSGFLLSQGDHQPRHSGAAGHRSWSLAMIFVATNLLVDLLQSLIDPRMRRGAEAMPCGRPATADRCRSTDRCSPPARACAATGSRSAIACATTRSRCSLALIVLLIVLAAIFAPLVAPFDPYKDSIIGRLKPFGYRGHLLGTDELGRDMLSRLIYGGRIVAADGSIPVLIATVVGGTLGVSAASPGGWVNTAIMRTMDVFYAFPSVLLAVAISGALGGGIANGMIALTLVFIPPICRVAETATTQVRSLDFIEAARASGARDADHHPPPRAAAMCWRRSSSTPPAWSASVDHAGRRACRSWAWA